MPFQWNVCGYCLKSRDSVEIPWATPQGEPKNQTPYYTMPRSRKQKGGNINAVNEEGRTELYFASEYDYVEEVRRLLADGADVNKATRDGFTPLYIASIQGHTDVVKALLEAGAMEPRCMLHQFVDILIL
jgi:hypothetical protein